MRYEYVTAHRSAESSIISAVFAGLAPDEMIAEQDRFVTSGAKTGRCGVVQNISTGPPDRRFNISGRQIEVGIETVRSPRSATNGKAVLSRRGAWPLGSL